MSQQAADLQDFYRRKVLDHSRAPHNFGRPEQVDREATGFNPLCGDKLSVYLHLTDNRITQAMFEGTGCAICLASASIMTEALAGQPIEQARQLDREVRRMFADGTTLDDPALTDMAALVSVRHYPSRVKCATLAWTTLEAALDGDTRTVSTEI